jgi:hypothetical protein
MVIEMPDSTFRVRSYPNVTPSSSTAVVRRRSKLVEDRDGRGEVTGGGKSQDRRL